MSRKNTFWLELVGFVVIFLCYGLYRLRLGIDLTDEGAFLAWPLQIHLGEAPFSSELLTLIRPVEVYLSFLFKLNPALTLYEFRLIGWTIHLLSFSVLSLFLFLLSDAPLRSLLTASVPFFLCHLLGLASPSYNTLSSDFLLMALSLWGISSVVPGSRLLLGAACGGAFFVATFSHPGLGLVLAVALAQQIWRGGLVSNCRGGRLTAPNIAMLVAAGSWLAFLTYFWASGALAHWLQRVAFSRSPATFTVSFPRFLSELMVHPFVHSRVALVSSFVLLAACVACWRSRDEGRSMSNRMILGTLMIVLLSITFSIETRDLPMNFVMVALVAVGMQLTPGLALSPLLREIRFLVFLSSLATLTYASLTYYFSPYRSWIAGMQGLPFAFAAATTLLVNVKSKRPAVLDLLLPASLALLVLCAARDHYRNIYRDGAPPALRASFNIPKLRQIKSTEERVRVLDSLYEHLHRKLQRGETLLVFDDCPMLYYVFDARSAYGLAWAVRYGQSPAALAKLNEELNDRPLPRYAIRSLVDVSHLVWSTAPRTNYANYPLNETVMSNYDLEETIFPFEIWRLRSAKVREKTFPEAVTP